MDLMSAGGEAGVAVAVQATLYIEGVLVVAVAAGSLLIRLSVLPRGSSSADIGDST